MSPTMRPTNGIVQFTPTDEDGHPNGPSTFVHAESIEATTEPEPERDGIDKLAADFAAIGDAFGEVLLELHGPFGRAAALLAAAFGAAAYIPPGWGRPPEGRPMDTGYAALYALNWAADTEVCGRLPKRLRRYAKRRYLECRRVIGPAEWRRLQRRRGGVAVNQFVST
jgi:hypothetical protein